MANTYHIKFSCQCNLTNDVLAEAHGSKFQQSWQHQNKQSVSIFVVSSYRYILISNEKIYKKKQTYGFSFSVALVKGCRFAVKLSPEKQLNQIKQKR